MPAPSHGSAHRYQSVGMMNLQSSGGSGGVSTNATSNQGGGGCGSGSGMPSQQIHSGGGSTSLPGLKRNLHSMKSAKKLQKCTPAAGGDQLMNSMKARRAAELHQLS